MRLEIGVALVVPVKLAGEALREAPVGLDPLRFRGVQEVQVHAPGALFRQRLERAIQQRRDGLLLRYARRDQEAPPRRGRKRNHRDQLRIITNAGPHRGLRPGEVEHVLAIAVLFDVQRQRGHELTRLSHDHVQRRPTGAAAYAAGLLQSEQKRVLDEGVIITRQTVPGFGGYPSQIGDELGLHASTLTCRRARGTSAAPRRAARDSSIVP